MENRDTGSAKGGLEPTRDVTMIWLRDRYSSAEVLFRSSYVGLEVGLDLTQIISSFEKSVSVYQSHVFGEEFAKSGIHFVQLLRTIQYNTIQIQSTESMSFYRNHLANTKYLSI